MHHFIFPTSNTWISSAYAISLNNCKPIFVDINESDYLMNTSLIEEKISKKTRKPKKNPKSLNSRNLFCKNLKNPKNPKKLKN